MKQTMKDYCYTIKSIENNCIKTDNCRFYRYIIIGEIRIPFCLRLCKGDISKLLETEVELLLREFTQAELDTLFLLTLLWDQVAECNHNEKEINWFPFEISGHESHYS